MTTRRILLVDDEDALRSSLTRALSREQDWLVVDAGSVDAALAAVDQQSPDLIVSDIDMPGRTGLELLGELGKRGLQVPVIFLTAYMKAFAAQIPRHRNVDMREKPMAIEDLRALIRERLAAAPSTAPAAPFAATDYLQLACMGAHSVVITLLRGEQRAGEIAILRGELWHASDSRSRGREAFTRLAFDTQLRAECRTLTGDPPERNLEGRWEALLIDAAREHDESGPGPKPQSKSFEQLWDVALDALLRKDHKQALAAFVAARKLRPDDGRVTANIRRLEDMGVREEVLS